MFRHCLVVLAAVLATAAGDGIMQAQPKDSPKSYVNSLGMKFVLIPPGEFMMGSPREELLRNSDETLHKVTLTKAFYMGIYPVTQEVWQEVMGKNPSRFQGEKNLPVETISWNDCQVFIKKLRERDKKPYRLPTEAEWEYACRAGTTTPFHFGAPISTDLANYNGNFMSQLAKKGKPRSKTTPVNTFPANAWGLHDMHGNVWQWCWDHYADYPQGNVVDPQGPRKTGVHLAGAALGNVPDIRVLRGGSWSNSLDYCRAAYRHWLSPDHRYIFIGARICFTAD